MESAAFDEDLREKTGTIQVLQYLQRSAPGDRMTAQNRSFGVLVCESTVGRDEISEVGKRKDVPRYSGEGTTGGGYDKDPGLPRRIERG